MEKLFISEIKFKAGSSPTSEGLTIPVPNVTILVGPNNSGKSQALRDIESWCQGKRVGLNVVEDLKVVLPTDYDSMRKMLDVHTIDAPNNQIVPPDHFWVARPTIRLGERQAPQQINQSQLRAWLDAGDLSSLGQTFIRMFTLRLDGRTRFDLVQAKETGPLESRPMNHLWALFANDESREKVRKFTEEAFSKHFVVDPTGMKEFRVRLAGRKPKKKVEEQGLDASSRAFHRGSPLISDLGDGVCASVGLVSAIMSLPDKILLIDEPEAFLHPTLSKKVGRVLSETAKERQASLIVATHSADFLMGCIQTAPDLRIVRLTFIDNKPTARSIEPSLVMDLMKDPLLRSTNALRALFHHGVVVTEADADRAFYDEINYRLLQAGRGIEDALFMNAQNWQTIPRIISPLRKLGIPAAAVFDLDVLVDKDFSHVWEILTVSKQILEKLQTERAAIKIILEKVERKSIKRKGLSVLAKSDETIVKKFIDEMSAVGVFFVPVGELECWLPHLGAKGGPGNKGKWLTDIFSLMGADPASATYIQAESKDVWEFIEKISDWISNPTRKGMPK